MAAAAPADAKAEAAKMDLLEDDDEFEEFEIDQGMRGPRLPPMTYPSPNLSSSRIAVVLFAFSRVGEATPIRRRLRSWPRPSVWASWFGWSGDRAACYLLRSGGFYYFFWGKSVLF